MLEKYQELLHKCIDKQEDQDRLNRMKKTSAKLKSNLIQLKGGNYMPKHMRNEEYIKQLEETIRLKDREIMDVKTECADQFKKIKDLCNTNPCGNINALLRRITEIADDNFITLLKDMFIENDEEGKIIELPKTRQSK